MFFKQHSSLHPHVVSGRMACPEPASRLLKPAAGVYIGGRCQKGCVRHPSTSRTTIFCSPCLYLSHRHCCTQKEPGTFSIWSTLFRPGSNCPSSKNGRAGGSPVKNTMNRRNWLIQMTPPRTCACYVFARFPPGKHGAFTCQSKTLVPDHAWQCCTRHTVSRVLQRKSAPPCPCRSPVIQQLVLPGVTRACGISDFKERPTQWGATEIVTHTNLGTTPMLWGN